MNHLKIPKPLSTKKGWPWQEPTTESRQCLISNRISIVTPSYNQGDYIEETIRSVLLQNYPNLEYIIVDGGSTDETSKILDHYRPFITHIIQEPDKGQADAIAKGLKVATGAIFNWLNSDDTYTPGALRLIATEFTNPNTHALLGRSRIYGKGKDRKSPGTDVYIDNLEKTIGQARIDQPETFFRLERIRQIGGVNTKLHYLMDRELWMRYLLTYGFEGIKKTDHVFVNFRLHSNSKTMSQQEGFELENILLGQTLAGKSTGDTFDLLRQAVQSRKIELSVPKIAEYWFLQQYTISYAERNFAKMDQYFAELRTRIRSWASARTIISLEVRKNLIKIGQKLYR